MITKFVKAGACISALSLFAACGGGDGDTTSTSGTGGGTTGGDTSDTSSGDISGLAGLFDPNSSGDFSASDLPDGTGGEFIARVQTISDLADGAFGSGFTSTPTVPNSGSANFSGAGVIVDVNIPETVNTIQDLAGYAAVATLAEASVDFGSGDFTARQYDYVDITDAPVSGEVKYSGKIDSSGFSDDTSASGSIAGTTVSATGPDNAGAGYLGGANPLFLGFFTDVGSGGTYDGVELGAGFFAAEN